MSEPLLPIQPFGETVNPFSRQFAEKLNGLGEALVQIQQVVGRNDARFKILSDRIPRQYWCIGRITARTAAINADYDAEPVWGAALFAQQLTPLMRLFSTSVVDVNAAEVGDPCFMFVNEAHEVNLIVWTETYDLTDCETQVMAATRVPSRAREDKISVRQELDFQTSVSASAAGLFAFNQVT